MEGLKVLLVDDEVEFVTTLAERLEIRGINATVALSGEEALQVIENLEPHVMVLDLKMPGITGMDVLRKVKKLEADIKTIMLTGHGSEKDRDEAFRIGAFDYLQKPVDIESLVRLLKEAAP